MTKSPSEGRLLYFEASFASAPLARKRPAAPATIFQIVFMGAKVDRQPVAAYNGQLFTRYRWRSAQ
jgi:hypothetical protein